MRYRIIGWHEYQHYKDRCPPWIKLHNAMLTLEVWVMGTDQTRTLAIACMLLAARDKANDGSFNGDPEYVKRFGYLNSKPDFKQLIEFSFIEELQDASTALAKCNTEKRREEKRKDIKPTSAKSAITIETFINNCDEAKERKIPEDDPVFDFADKAGIPIEMVQVCWKMFVQTHRENKKRQKDWRATFRNCVKGNWYKLWFVEADGTVKETSQYRALKKGIEDV